ncbi:methyltransferase-like 26 isoform X1 [Patagioenas fasciata]|uniref:methyltransferase-like 26 isoform X1 n=1 Tax=Patagioenas fasciata TaxID=372321 RepID=UPI003A9908B9
MASRAAGVVVSCKIPILATRVRFPGGARFFTSLFTFFYAPREAPPAVRGGGSPWGRLGLVVPELRPTPAPAMQAPAAAERNKGPILSVLRQYVGSGTHRGPGVLRVLEVGAGAGLHAAYFAQALPQTRWQPSDIDPQALRSIAAYAEAMHIPNMLPPILLDVSQSWEMWGGTQPNTLDLLISINMMHISELWCTEGLFKGAGVLLKPGGVLFTYGVGAAHRAWVFLGMLEVADGRTAPGTACGGDEESRGLSFGGGLRLSRQVLSLEWGCFGHMLPGREGTCPPSPHPGQGPRGPWGGGGARGGVVRPVVTLTGHVPSHLVLCVVGTATCGLWGSWGHMMVHACSFMSPPALCRGWPDQPPEQRGL